MRLKFFIDPSGQGPGVGRDGLEGSGASRAGGKTSGWRNLGPAGPHGRNLRLGRKMGPRPGPDGSGVPGRAVGPRLGGDATDGREEELQAIQGGPGE